MFLCNRHSKLKLSYILALTLIFVLTSFFHILDIDVYASGNADLKDVIIVGGVLEFPIEKDKFKYNVSVSKEVTEIEVTGIPEDPNAKVEVSGITTDYQIGKTYKVKIIVTSADNTNQNKYEFYVTRKNVVVTPSPVPTVDPSTVTPTPTDEATETPVSSPSPSPTVNETDDETEPTKSSVPVDNKPASKNDNTEKVTIISTFDLGFCVVLAFLAGIIVGYGIFYYSNRKKKLVKKLWID